MGFAPSILHGKRLLGEDCLLWLKLCVAGVEGVTGSLAKGSPPSLSACGDWYLRVPKRTHSSAD